MTRPLMSYGGAFGAVVADVDSTIVHWKNRGVTADEIGAQLHCQRHWPAIRRRMIRLALPFRMRVIEGTLIHLNDQRWINGVAPFVRPKGHGRRQAKRLAA